MRYILFCIFYLLLFCFFLKKEQYILVIIFILRGGAERVRAISVAFVRTSGN